MKKGLLLYHRGWTDQISMLPIINYYKTIYDDLTILLVPEVKPIYDFYLKNTTITILYSDYYRTNNIPEEYFLNTFNPSVYDYLFHGKHDMHRFDKYKNVYLSSPWLGNNYMHFGKRYYEFYDIDFINKINYFEFNRDYQEENLIYDKFIQQYTDDYILYHDNFKSESNLLIKSNNFINLNGYATDIFKMVKVLECSKEIHLIDSVWASFCYLVDAKYKLFQNIPIYLYPFTTKQRWGGLLKDLTYKSELKLEPINLNNWTIVM